MFAKFLSGLATLGLCAACASTNTIARAPSADSASDRYHRYALAPVDSFTAFRFDSWTSLSRNEVVIWPRFDEAYRQFTERHSLREVGVEPDFASTLRDRDPGRKVRL